MIAFVDFVSAAKIESMRGDPSWAVVSITDPGSTECRIDPHFGPILKLQFDDLDEDSLASGSTGRVFTPEDAKTVLSFLDGVNRDAGITGLLVNCEMGRSRSGAIAWFALSYGGKMLHERRIDGYNNLVLSMLEQVGSVQLPRPTGMLAPAGLSLTRP